MSRLRIYKKGTFERFTLTCPMEDVEKLWKKADKMGLRMLRGGPKSIAFGRIDPNVYQFIGERRID